MSVNIIFGFAIRFAIVHYCSVSSHVGLSNMWVILFYSSLCLWGHTFPLEIDSFVSIVESNFQGTKTVPEVVKDGA